MRYRRFEDVESSVFSYKDDQEVYIWKILAQ